MPSRKTKLVRRKSLRLTRNGAMVAAAAVLVATGATAYVVKSSYAAGCVPSGAVWSSSSATGSYYAFGYAFHNNEWGAVTGSKQTMWVKDAGTWGVCAYQPNPPSSVKAYPEQQQEVGKTIGSLANATNSVSYSVPSKGTWNASDDLWINGHPGDAGVKEVMFWTYTHYQQPAGTKIGTASFGGTTWNVWVRSGTNPIYTFQRQSNVTSATIHMLSGFNWLVSNGYLKSTDTFTQFNWGFELVGTGGATRNFNTTSLGLTIN